MTNMEVASYLGLVNLTLSQIDVGPDDLITPKMLESVRISQLYFYQQAMEELKKLVETEES